MLSKTRGNLIENYDARLVEPGCTPGAGRWGALVIPPQDISSAFPYLNTVYEHTIYDYQNQILIIREKRQAYAMRPLEIRIARVDSPEQAVHLARDIVDKVDQVWFDRENITPRFTEKKNVKVIDIFKLLPKTNCRKCGYLTCLACSAALREGTAGVESCPEICLSENAEKRKKLESLFEDNCSN